MDYKLTRDSIPESNDDKDLWKKFKLMINYTNTMLRILVDTDDVINYFIQDGGAIEYKNIVQNKEYWKMLENKDITLKWVEDFLETIVLPKMVIFTKNTKKIKDYYSELAEIVTDWVFDNPNVIDIETILNNALDSKYFSVLIDNNAQYTNSYNEYLKLDKEKNSN